MSYAQPELPPSFFKYRSLRASGEDLERLKQIILESKIYWPSPLEFNDPFDCAPTYKFPKGNELKKMAAALHRKHNPNAPRKEMRKFVAYATKGGGYSMQADFGERMKSLLADSSVYSLAVDPTNILMWAHYANSHKGVCVRLDTQLLLKSFTLLAPVEYETERPSVMLTKEEPELLLRKTLLTKSTHWKYEEEWRLLGYKERKGLRSLARGCINGLVFGSRIEPEDRDQLETLVADCRDPIALFQADCDSSQFAINLTPINEQAKRETLGK